MPGKHRFVIVVLLGAAVVAGFFALGRSAQLGAASETAAPALVSARARSLDRLEAQLRRQLAALEKTTPAAPSLASPSAFVVPEAPVAASYEEDEDDEDDDDHGAEHHDGELAQTDGDD